MDQLLNTKTDLESYFKSDVLTENPWMSSEWVFVPMLYCEEIEQEVKISQTCVDFVIQGKYRASPLSTNSRVSHIEMVKTKWL